MKLRVVKLQVVSYLSLKMADASEKEQYFKGKVALITGGSRGIGFATASAFGRAGAQVAIFSKNQESLDTAIEDLNEIGDVFGRLVDIRDYEETKDFVGQVIDRYHRIDFLINNAGVAWIGDFVDEDKENIDELIDTNVKGVLYATKIVLPGMIGQRNGVIINISSGAGLAGISTLATYCTTKFGVVGFTQSLAREVDRHGIRVYAVCPGAVATDMQKLISGMRLGIPPEKVAGKILELAGPNPEIEVGNCLKVFQ
jgi:3-oxoacyl-[acyl-carrier protein] reductase